MSDVTTPEDLAKPEAVSQEVIDVLAHFGIDINAEFSEQGQADVDAVLAHFGVPGMKWGRRHARGADGRVNKSKSPEVDKTKEAGARSESKSSKAAHKPKLDVKSMTNEELQSTIKRLQLEQQIVQLTAPKKSEAKAFIKEVLLNAGKQEATKFAAEYMNKGLKVAMTKGGAAMAKGAVKAAVKP